MTRRNGGHGDHSHSHGLVDPSIARSREGLRVVAASLAILALTALAQGAIYVATGSVALLADLIHNAGDALTALPLAVAFLLRSARAERAAGLAVVLAILVSAISAGAFAIERLFNPLAPEHLLALALAGLIGVLGNELAARVRLRGGRRLDSAALIADGNHARTDALASAGVVLSAAVVALGAPIADPLVGLAITALILHVTWDSWRTVRGHARASCSRTSTRRSSVANRWRRRPWSAWTSRVSTPPATPASPTPCSPSRTPSRPSRPT